MKVFLLSVHIIAAILAIGPVAVAASLFPRYARHAADGTGGRALPAALHRITRVYATVGILVPVFGLATALSMGVLGDTWLQVSIALTALAAALLILRVLPGQRGLMEVLEGLPGTADSAAGPAGSTAVPPGARRLAMTTGVFNLLWAVVVVLMIMRPGSSTSVHL